MNPLTGVFYTCTVEVVDIVTCVCVSRSNAHLLEIFLDSKSELGLGYKESSRDAIESGSLE